MASDSWTSSKDFEASDVLFEFLSVHIHCHILYFSIEVMNPKNRMSVESQGLWKVGGPIGPPHYTDRVKAIFVSSNHYKKLE